jgi:hypothetical protein
MLAFGRAVSPPPETRTRRHRKDHWRRRRDRAAESMPQAFRSRKFREMAKSKSLEDVRLHGRRLFVHGVGTKGGTDDRARRAAPFRLRDEPCDGLGDLARIWRAGRQ